MGGGAQEQDGQGPVVAVSTAVGHRLDRVDLMALVAPGDAPERLELRVWHQTHGREPRSLKHLKPAQQAFLGFRVSLVPRRRAEQPLALGAQRELRLVERLVAAARHAPMRGGRPNAPPCWARVAALGNQTDSVSVEGAARIEKV